MNQELNFLYIIKDILTGLYYSEAKYGGDNWIKNIEDAEWFSTDETALCTIEYTPLIFNDKILNVERFIKKSNLED